MASSFTIVAISDTHEQHSGLDIPPGDLLIHAGDFSKRGSLESLQEFNDFLGTLTHAHKVVIAGNHDFCFERSPALARQTLTHAIYLQDEEVEIAGFRIWGSPWQPRFFDWAFNLDRGPALQEKWDLIPEGIDILVTHGPPHGILDTTARGPQVGCEALRARVLALQPALHIFGHIHEDYGQHTEEGVRFVNASTCDLRYRPVHPPVVLTLPLP